MKILLTVIFCVLSLASYADDNSFDSIKALQNISDMTRNLETQISEYGIKKFEALDFEMKARDLNAYKIQLERFLAAIHKIAEINPNIKFAIDTLKIEVLRQIPGAKPGLRMDKNNGIFTMFVDKDNFLLRVGVALADVFEETRYEMLEDQTEATFDLLSVEAIKDALMDGLIIAQDT